MALLSNRIVITVTPARYTETVELRAVGRHGKTSLRVPNTRRGPVPLTAAPDAKTYWTAILAAAQEALQGL
jgi:hypothetical protein